MNPWHKASWRKKITKQQPTYEDKNLLEKTQQELENLPPLVFAGEVRELQNKLEQAGAGKAFILQGGDCAESFAEFKTPHIRDFFKSMLQMAIVLTYGTKLPVIKIARIAGQFAKPRSQEFETQNNVTFPCYRGDIINSIEFTKKARMADPTRMLQAYRQSTSSLNLLRAFATGGLADLHQVHKWTLDFVKNDKISAKYVELAEKIQRTLDFMSACGINSNNTPELKTTSLYTSHEALLLPYEQALTRKDSLTEQYYDCSAHMLWIGERTKNINEGHIEFIRGIANPVGIKVGAPTKPDELLALLDLINPKNIMGKINLISRMGGNLIQEKLPNLLQTIKCEGKNVVWTCDPMHGNTIKSKTGYKTRKISEILFEIKNFFEICKANDSIGAGIHLEMTGKNVTECMGGVFQITEKDLSARYHTHCDPRLNADQALEIAFLISDMLKT